MKTLTAVVLTGLLSASAAFASSAPTPAAAPVAAPAKAAHDAARNCHKQGAEKKLHGAALEKFVKDCSAGTAK